MIESELNWLTQENWIQGAHAKTIEGEEVHYNDLQAAGFDLYSALRKTYEDTSDWRKVASSIKQTFKIMFPHKYKSLEARYSYRDADNNIVPFVPLYAINDALKDYSELKRILFFI